MPARRCCGDAPCAERISLNDMLTLAARSAPPRFAPIHRRRMCGAVDKGRRGNVIDACGDPKSAAQTASTTKPRTGCKREGSRPPFCRSMAAHNAAPRLPLRQAGLMSAARECRR